ncbi:MFS transporter [Humibacter ginsengisoli]
MSTTAGETASFSTSQRWRRLLPIVFVTYSFAYLDRGNYSIGAAGGLQHDLNISSFQAGLLGGLFFLGYFIFQVPAAAFAEKRSAKRLLFWSLILWGLFAAAQGVIPNYPLLLVDRFLLGVVEATVIPALLVFLMHWFSDAERGRADSFMILGHPVTLLWMSALSGYIIQATNWRWMFIIEGLPAIVWAFIFRYLVDDRPSDADWLHDAEREELRRRLDDETRGEPPAKQWSALKSPRVILLAIQYGLWSIGVYGVVFWLPTVLKSMSGAGIGATGVLTAIPYALATVLMIIASWVSDRTHQRRWLVLGCLLAGAVVFYFSFLIGIGNFLPAFILLIVATGLLYAPYGPYFALIPEVVPENIAGTGMGAVNAIGGLGGFIGPVVVGWLVGGTGSTLAFLFLGACLAAAGLLMLFVHPRRRAPGANQDSGENRRAEGGARTRDAQE